MLLRCARTDSAETAEAFRFNILQAGQALIEAQPAMAPLVNLVNTVLWRLGTSNTLAEMRTIVDTVVRDFKRRLHMHETAVAEAALPLILDHVIVMTHSRSTTVRAALFHASRAQRRFQVVCSESRPIYEGRTLATELAEALPEGPFDLLQTFAQPLPVRIIARLLGVPESMAPDLLSMVECEVGMYMAGRDRVTITSISDGGCMEGEAREAFVAIPGFASAGKMAPYVLIISDNNTGLTGRIDESSYSMAP
ncbi:MAG: hypothetical protein HC893_09695, partial [Chloroflexaceae bacterium]|nr:hypothetical protein [Chloroflexaceae bacterium]